MIESAAAKDVVSVFEKQIVSVLIRLMAWNYYSIADWDFSTGFFYAKKREFCDETARGNGRPSLKGELRSETK